MRLSEYEHQILLKHCNALFPHSRLYLFGSRTDDKKRGGDIDLYLETEDKSDLFRRKITFLSKVKRDLGDQKIDLIFNEDESRLIEQEARQWAIRL